MRGFLDILFKVVSILGHPILLPTYFALSINDIYELSTLRVTTFTFVLPVLVMSIVYAIARYRQSKAQKASDGYVVMSQQDVEKMSGGWADRFESFFDTTRNRSIALAVVVVVASVGYILFAGLMWRLIMMFTAFASLACLLINNFWRLSIHSFGWGFAIYLLIFNYSYVFYNPYLLSVLLILVCGLVISSRLYLGRHNGLQVHLGFALGVIVPALFNLYVAFKM